MPSDPERCLLLRLYLSSLLLSPSEATADLYLASSKKVLPDPATSDKPKLPVSEQITSRGTESSASQYIAQLYSA